MRIMGAVSMQKTVSVFFATLLGAAGWAFAAEEMRHSPSDLTELNIEELMNVTVYGASKFDQKLSEAPSSVNIVTADEIKKYGYRTLADVLKSERGFYITSDRNYSYIGVRGFGRPGDFNTRILLLIDGHRANDNIYNSATPGTEFPLNIDLIDRIEVIRGPSSSIYGTNAFFAVISIITKKGRDLKGVESSGDAGSLDTYTGRLSVGNNFLGGRDVLVSGSIMDSKGNHRLYYRDFDSPATNNGIAENCDYDRSYNFFSKVSWNNVTLEGVFGSRTKGIPTASYGTVFNDSRNETIDERGYLDLKYENNLGDRSRILARLFYDRYKFDGTYVFDYPPITVLKLLDWGEWWGGEMQVTTTELKNNKIIGGLEYEDNIRQDQYSYDETPYFAYLDDKRNSKRWAAYVQDELALSKNVIFNAGVRYDHYETFGTNTNPRLSLMYNPLDKTTLKVLYGTAFRVPNVYELYYDDSGLTQKANPDLKPEKITTYELVLEQFLGENLRVSAAGFQYKTKDLITLETDPGDGLMIYRNTEKVSANGLELELENRWKSGMRGRISYTIQKVTDDATHELSVNSPRQLAKFNFTASMLNNKLFVALEEQYTDRRKTVAGNYAGGFFITNVTLFSRQMVKGLELSGSVYNLFDKAYGDPSGTEHIQDIIEQNGRTYRVKLTYAF
jgi:iron complex outermembrane receptor protein